MPAEPMSPPGRPSEVVRSLHRAASEHDLERIVAHFAAEYVLENPSHPDRGFRGAEQVRRNWSEILGALPDLVVDEHGLVEDGDRVWTEISMRGHRRDGAAHELCGVMIFRVVDGRIAEGRFHLSAVVRDGLGPDAAVRAMTTGDRP